ncbi:MAG TPA: carboxypeptidase-like regulatory domain-containing protein [Methanocellaceae archaeon]
MQVKNRCSKRDMIMKGAATICIFLSLIAIVILSSGCTGIGQPAPTATPLLTSTAQPTVQPPTYEITGTVRDFMGLPVYNAKVTIWQNDKILDVPNNPQYSSYSDSSTMGQYDFKHVPKGSYRITAELKDQSGSIIYPDSGLTDIFIRDPTPTPVTLFTPSATVRPITTIYLVSFNIDRSSSHDVIITNTGGDITHLQTVRISFINNFGDIVGPDTTLNLANNGVTGDLNKNVGSMCDIAGDVSADPTHVIVYGSFDDGTMQVLSSADV